MSGTTGTVAIVGTPSIVPRRSARSDSRWRIAPRCSGEQDTATIRTMLAGTLPLGHARSGGG